MSKPKPQRIEIEGSYDFNDWGWGDPPGDVLAAHKKSCIIGAETLFNDLTRSAYFKLDGWNEDGLTACLMSDGGLAIVGKLELPDVITYDQDEIEKLIDTLRRLADELQAKLNAV